MGCFKQMTETKEVLLVDDNPADLDLTADILSRNTCSSHIHKVLDGVRAMAFLRKQGECAQALRPDVVLLDLNLPGKSGLEVLAEMKADFALKNIPVVIFSTSAARADIYQSYQLGANCYMAKPGNLKDFISTVTSFGNYWFSCALFPERENYGD
jgi:two-component system, chemotaxis family, response regulator Rcp1